MKIGITYDVAEMYSVTNNKGIHFDFANSIAINRLKENFEAMGCTVELISGVGDLLAKISKSECDFDIIYNTVEGINSRNREGLVPAILEAYNIPFMGTDSFGVSLSLNKLYTKILAQYLGILTPKYCFFGRGQQHLKREFPELHKIPLPLILKPNLEGNSSGICVCNTYDEAKNEILNLLELFNTDILCEEFIFGKEITVPVIGNNPQNMFWGVTTVNIQSDDSFWLDVNQKVYGDYKNVMLSLSPELNHNFKQIVFKLFAAIGCRDFARFDFRLSSDDKIYFIEANPLPCFFQGGSFDTVGKYHGYTYNETLKLLLNTSCERLSIPKI